LATRELQELADESERGAMGSRLNMWLTMVRSIALTGDIEGSRKTVFRLIHAQRGRDAGQCCELDAAYFHLYGIAREDVDYIMETFPIVKRKDEAAHSEYRTKRVVLEIYDEMARAMEAWEPYQTRLDPPLADPRVAHPAR
jgi:hypothetical protein